MQWDLFCRVVDNFGDVGFGWRLAAELAARGENVRLWLDDASALAWMAPEGARSVSVRRWSEATAAVTSGEVVVETFGCGLPDPFLAQMAARPRPPVWINLEYLSAEAFAQRNHGLPSPHHDGPGAGLRQWYFYPGFTAASGGLLRESSLADRRQRFSRAAWLESVAVDRGQPGSTRLVSLFCYQNLALPALLDALQAEPTLLLVTVGRAAFQVERELGPRLERGGLRAVVLPRLRQVDYDHLLWSCDLNLVRGEDSFVRAQWAGVPFVWQIYPQQDGAHIGKLDAFLDLYVRGASDALADELRAVFAAWNGLAGWPRLPPMADWRAHCEAWRATLSAQTDLGDRLQAFASSKMLK